MQVPAESALVTLIYLEKSSAYTEDFWRPWQIGLKINLAR